MSSLACSDIVLHLWPLTAAEFAPYGEVIEATATPIAINDGKTLRFHDLANIDPGEQGRTIVSIFRTTPTSLPFTIRKMERHPLGSQAFVPLSSRPYIIVVAPAGPFIPDRLRAFRADGTQGVNFRKGTWHHFNLALEVESQFIVLDRSGPGVNFEEVSLGLPVTVSASL